MISHCICHEKTIGFGGKCRVFHSYDSNMHSVRNVSMDMGGTTYAMLVGMFNIVQSSEGLICLNK